MVGGAVNNAGLVIDWLGAQLFPEAGDPVARVLAEAAQSPPGARGVVCEPRLAGERYPDYSDAVVRYLDRPVVPTLMGYDPLIHTTVVHQASGSVARRRGRGRCRARR